MMPFFPPIPPVPPRSAFRTEHEYMAACLEHARIVRSRNDIIKDHDAILILMSVTFVVIGMGVLGVALYFAFGWRSIAYAIAVAGLYWVAFVQIRRRL